MQGKLQIFCEIKSNYAIFWKKDPQDKMMDGIYCILINLVLVLVCYD